MLEIIEDYSMDTDFCQAEIPFPQNRCLSVHTTVREDNILERSGVPANNHSSKKWVSIHGPLGPCEQLGDPVSQGCGLGGVLGALLLDPLDGGLLRLLENTQVEA